MFGPLLSLVGGGLLKKGGEVLFGGKGTTLTRRPKPPSLDSFGIGKEGINDFIALRRMMGRQAIQSQGATASRSAAAKLPGSLRSSTVPAAIQAGISTDIASQIGELDAQLSEAEIEALMKVYQLELSRFSIVDQQNASKQKFLQDAVSTAALLPFL